MPKNILTAYSQVDQRALRLAAIIGRRAGIEARMNATHALQHQATRGDDDAPGYVLCHGQTLQQRNVLSRSAKIIVVAMDLHRATR